MATSSKKQAKPLVLPSNYVWNDTSGKCEIKPNEKRGKLTIVKHALEQLQKIKGPVCVVAIAGPYKKGKSYALSKAFGQEQVFPIGHNLDVQTIGIWLWIVPKKFKDSSGQEFTVVLLDSEGIDSPSRSDDSPIFTLIVLLSSILIYNSAGVAGRSDLENLDFIFKLSERIQRQTFKTDVQNGDDFYAETFPYLIWLLRDFTLRLPKEYRNTRDYIINKVLVNYKEMANSRETAESISKIFLHFDAFDLPPPTCDPMVLANLDERKKEDFPEFHKQFESFKDFLHTKLSINKRGFVTGEVLADLIQRFVKALNTPDAVPNVQNAWDTFVQTKCSEVLADAVKVYEQGMMSLVEKKIPCEADLLRSAHDNAMKKCENFRNEIFTFSIKSVDKYSKELTEKTDSILTSWVDKNRRQTETFCTQLLKDLKSNVLESVLACLSIPEGCKMQLDDITDPYIVQNEYDRKAKGPYDVQKAVLTTFNPELQRIRELSKCVVNQMNSLDESLANEKEAKAELEKKRQKAEEEKKDKETEIDRLRESHTEQIAGWQAFLCKNSNIQQQLMASILRAIPDEQEVTRSLSGQSTLLEEISNKLSNLVDNGNLIIGNTAIANQNDDNNDDDNNEDLHGDVTMMQSP